MTQNITIRIKRFNPDMDKKPYWQDFTVAMTAGKTILDALEEIKAEQDGSLTFRRSCRHAICGSCAMMINRRNTLVCNKSLADTVDEDNTILIEPLPYIPVIKDLVVDRSAFWEQYQAVKPWLIPVDATSTREYRMTQEEVEAMEAAETCIMCGACYSSCPVVAGNKHYIGPHALLKAFSRVADPRDAATLERLNEVATDKGVFRCHMVLNCVDACPKGLDPAKAIATLAKMSLRARKYANEKEARQSTLIAVDDIPVKEPATDPALN